MRCPRSVKNRILLAEVGPISSTQSGSSELKTRESSAMALERRVWRCEVFGAGGAAGVLRKNFMEIADCSGRLQPATYQRVPSLGNTNPHLNITAIGRKG